MDNKKGYWLIFDSYNENNEEIIQSHMKEFGVTREIAQGLKKMEWDTKFKYVMRYAILPPQKQLNIIQQIIEIIKKILGLQIKQIETMTTIKTLDEEIQEEPEKTSRLDEWARCIEIYENSPKSWCNPGAIKKRDGTFIKFSTYQEGFDYLKNYLTRAATGEHLAYPKGGETTLLEFQNIYSPTNDNNDPVKYAQYVADKLRISIHTEIRELI